MLQLKVTKTALLVIFLFFCPLLGFLKPSGTESKLWHCNLKGWWGLKVCRWIKTAWSCSPWTCQLQPTSLKWERGGKGKELAPEEVEIEEVEVGCNFIAWCWLTDLALAKSPRWSGCTSGPVMADPRNFEQPQCCSTSRAASRSPPSPASKRPCWLRWKHRDKS